MSQGRARNGDSTGRVREILEEESRVLGEALRSQPSESRELEPQTQAPVPPPRVSLRYLIRALLKYNASDLHLRIRRPPLYRINGKLVPAKLGDLPADQIEALLLPLLKPTQREQLERTRSLDFSFSIEELGRFRCNLYYQRGGLSAAIRAIPLAVPRFDDLHLPEVLKEFVVRTQGLLLVTGATGSGKSTTLAALISHLNETRHVHVLSIEDPIEFSYRDHKATISQRELGTDAVSFNDALKSALRQDPDVIVIGEMRDRETIQAALTAAETGHLVLSTLHTNDAKSTIDRILDVFPSEQQNQVRIQLAANLIGVVSQRLLMRADRAGRMPVCEVLVNSPSIEQLILRNEREKIPEIMASSSSYYKMQTLNGALERLVRLGRITRTEALKVSLRPEDLELKLSGIAREAGYDIPAWGGAEAEPAITTATDPSARAGRKAA